jgi:hypothetical protein
MSLIVAAGIVTGLAANLWLSVRWYRRYKDLRALRAVVAGVGLLCGGIALGIAAWSLRTDGPERILEIMALLVQFGEGVLLMVTVALLYSSARERRT